MLTRNLSIALAAAIALVLATNVPLFAVPTTVHYQNAANADGTEHCDPLLIPQDVDEIGDIAGGFPPDEELSHFTTQVNTPVCLATDDALMPDALVGITNLTGRALNEVWYVANNETRISNFDGYANDIGFPVDFDNEAFRIDSAISDPGGVHHPLVFESGVPNDIWEAGETWHFILQDYGNLLFIPADFLVSIGVGDASIPMPGAIESSGSIIAIPKAVVVPEPGTLFLASLGLAGIVITRRRL